MKSGNPEPRAGWRARAGAAALVIIIWATTALAYRSVWPTTRDFVTAIDHCDILFCDFDRYFYRQGQVILDAKQPISAYLHSAPFAVTLSLFRGMPPERARLIWATVEIMTTLGVFLAPFLFMRRRGPVPWLHVALYALAFATCTAVLHNFKWGQVSGLMALGILLSLGLADRGRSVAAGLVLAVPIAIKYYAAPALIIFVFRRDWRALAACTAGLAAAAALSMAAIGVAETLAFQRTVSEHALAASRDAWVRADANSQFFAHVIGRWTGTASRAWVFAGYAICVVNAAVLWWLCRARSQDAVRWAAILILASTPFWVDTSWPHYFIYLPALQWLIADTALADARRWARAAALTLIAASVFAASTAAMLMLFGTWAPFSASGSLFVANAAVLVAAYLLIPFAGKRIAATFRPANAPDPQSP